MTFIETFHGYIETTADTLLVFEACRRGILPKITRRLQEKERSMIRSGTVLVFDERESGIKRWTDGLVWSPSRILGNFLIYRELVGLNKRHDKYDDKDPRYTMSPPPPSSSYPYDRRQTTSSSLEQINKHRERALVGSLTTSYRFKPDGLIKKTMSIVVNGSHLHLISYYNKDDVLNNILATPSSTPQLAHLHISDMIQRQSFRVSPLLELSSAQLYPQPQPPSSSHDATIDRRDYSPSLPSPSSSPPCAASSHTMMYYPSSLTKPVNYVTYNDGQHQQRQRRRSPSPVNNRMYAPRKASRISTDDSSVQSSVSSISSPHEHPMYSGESSTATITEYLMYGSNATTDTYQLPADLDIKSKTSFMPMNTHLHTHQQQQQQQQQPTISTKPGTYHHHPAPPSPMGHSNNNTLTYFTQHRPQVEDTNLQQQPPLLPPPTTMSNPSPPSLSPPVSDRQLYPPIRQVSMPTMYSSPLTTPF